MINSFFSFSKWHKVILLHTSLFLIEVIVLTYAMHWRNGQPWMDVIVAFGAPFHCMCVCVWSKPLLDGFLPLSYVLAHENISWLLTVRNALVLHQWNMPCIVDFMTAWTATSNHIPAQLVYIVGNETNMFSLSNGTTLAKKKSYVTNILNISNKPTPLYHPPT